MHGKKRADYKAKLRDPATAAALQQKAEQWQILVKEIHRRRRSTQDTATSSTEKEETEVTKKTMALLEKALLVNPDPLYLWNHRRESIVSSNPSPGIGLGLGLTVVDPSVKSPYLTRIGTGIDGNKAKIGESLSTELALTQAALQRNPKAYGAWMHRKWILQYAYASESVLQTELILTAQLLQLDERNFHCWNYRRFVVGCLALADEASVAASAVVVVEYTGLWKDPDMGPQLVPRRWGATPGTPTIPTPTPAPSHETTLSPELLEQEWEFTNQKIQDNFSNFSAFHYRSQLLGRKLELVRSTNESADMSSLLEVWSDEFQLIENAVCTEPDDQTAWWYQALLLDHIRRDGMDEYLRSRMDEHKELLHELLGEAPTNKWILLGLHRLAQRQGSGDEATAEQRRLLDELKTVDPDRSQRYQELLCLL